MMPRTVDPATLTKPLPTEAEMQRAIVQCATVLGYRVSHTYLSINSPSGWPDLVMVRARPPKRIVVAELKGPRGRVSQRQREWLDDLSTIAADVNAGAGYHLMWVCLWWPEDWLSGQVEKVLRGEV